MEVNPSLTDKAQHDLLLVKKVLNSGDRQAYAELMKTYADQVYATMLNMTG